MSGISRPIFPKRPTPAPPSSVPSNPVPSRGIDRAELPRHNQHQTGLAADQETGPANLNFTSPRFHDVRPLRRGRVLWDPLSVPRSTLAFLNVGAPAGSRVTIPAAECMIGGALTPTRILVGLERCAEEENA